MQDEVERIAAGVSYTPELIAAAAYQYADAMLAARIVKDET